MDGDAMKQLCTYLLLITACLLAGCLPTYVGDPEKAVMDEHLLGVWHLNDKDQQLWFVQKLDAHQYLIQAYTFQDKDGVATLSDGPKTLSGWLATVNGETYLSMRMFDTKQVTDPSSAEAINRYIVTRLKIDGDTAKVEGISEDFLKKYGVTTPTQFEDALTVHAKDAGTFGSAMQFDRVDLHNTGGVQKLLDLIHSSPL
jgi:hypothetical protein